MAYTPNTWVTGDTITATKLNNMEQGIASAGGAVQVGYTFSDGIFTLDKTWQEINDGMAAGNTFIVIFDPDDFPGWAMGTLAALIVSVDHYDNNYSVRVSDSYYESSSPTDYPSFNMGD